MRFSKFFIDRPIFAAVLSLLIVAAGAIALVKLPISEYPQVVPPTVVVQATKQSPYLPYRHFGRALNMPLNKIRIIQPHIGGGFGGKQDALAA